MKKNESAQEELAEVLLSLIYGFAIGMMIILALSIPAIYLMLCDIW